MNGEPTSLTLVGALITAIAAVLVGLLQKGTASKARIRLAYFFVCLWSLIVVFALFNPSPVKLFLNPIKQGVAATLVVVDNNISYVGTNSVEAATRFHFFSETIMQATDMADHQIDGVEKAFKGAARKDCDATRNLLIAIDTKIVAPLQVADPSMNSVAVTNLQMQMHSEISGYITQLQEK